MNPGGGSGWDEPPLDIQIPDDARELDRDVLAYHRELRARRRRHRLRRLTAPFGGQGTVMPLLASILAVCLVAGVMLSVATFSPSTGPEHLGHHPAASGLPSAARRSGTGSAAAPTSATQTASTQAATAQHSAAASLTAASPAGGGTARPSGSANVSARSDATASATATTLTHLPGGP